MVMPMDHRTREIVAEQILTVLGLFVVGGLLLIGAYHGVPILWRVLVR